MTFASGDAALYADRGDGWEALGGVRSFSMDLGPISRDTWRLLCGLPPLCCCRYDDRPQCDRPASSTVHAAGRDWPYCGPHGRMVADRVSEIEVSGWTVRPAFMESLRAPAEPLPDPYPTYVSTADVTPFAFQHGDFSRYLIPDPWFIPEPPAAWYVRLWRRLVGR